MDEAKNKADEARDNVGEPRRGPLFSLDGLKQKASQILGGHHDAPHTEADGGAKQRASQFLSSAQNETADTLGDTEDRRELSQSTAGVTPHSADHAGSNWDVTKDKSHADAHSGPELNWNEVKQRASQMLGSVANETADTFNDSADRTTLSESTVGATKPGAHSTAGPFDATHAKTQAPEYHEPVADWKTKASQILESFANETADTFDTVQDRESITESMSAAAPHKPEAAATPFDHTGSKTPVNEKVQEALDQGREDASRTADDTQAHAGGLLDALREKAAGVLGSIQQSTEAAREQAGKASHDANDARDAALRKMADTAGVASDRASMGGFSTPEPEFTSETRRATAGQVADYAAR